MIRVGITVLTICVLAFTFAGEATAQGRWGAIAFSTTDGRFASCWNAPTQADALAGSVQYCRRNGGTACQAVVWVPSGYCAALASGYNNWGVGWSPVQQYNFVLAETLAGQIACRYVNGECTIRDYVCADARTHIPPELGGPQDICPVNPTWQGGGA